MTAAPADPATDVFWRPSAALQVAHSHPRSRRVAQAIVAAICAFTIILTAAPAAFALGVSIAETSVAAQTSTGHSFVGAKTTDASTGVGENRAGIYDFTSGCCVAPNSSAGDGLLGPGPYAGDSIPGDSTRNFSQSQRNELNAIMDETGCHRCGTNDPGTKSGNAIPDHQPPLSLSDGPFDLYPHCLDCSRLQGLEIARLKRLGLLE